MRHLPSISSATPYVLGGMSGTSTDGVDVSLLRYSDNLRNLQFIECLSNDFTDELRQALLALQTVSKDMLANHGFLHFLQARQALSDVYSRACTQLLKKTGVKASKVAAYGVHGQTLRHRPDLGITYQMIDPARVAAHTGIAVVSDFRGQDVAYGGQGAPLVPSFHAKWLSQEGYQTPAVVLNLGGFSNLTLLNADGEVEAGGDCGPANCLLDAWCFKAFGKPFDAGGALASAGNVNDELLKRLQQHPFFAQAWPKSTGRDDFHLTWLDELLRENNVSDVDVLRTLVQLSVWCVADSLKKLPVGIQPQVMVVAGGGVKNKCVMRALSSEMPELQIITFQTLGLPDQAVESSAFAWFAGQFLQGEPIACVKVTGAKALGIAGCLSLP